MITTPYGNGRCQEAWDVCKYLQPHTAARWLPHAEKKWCYPYHYFKNVFWQMLSVEKNTFCAVSCLNGHLHVEDVEGGALRKARQAQVDSWNGDCNGKGNGKKNGNSEMAMSTYLSMALAMTMAMAMAMAGNSYSAISMWIGVQGNMKTIPGDEERKVAQALQDELAKS